MRGQIRALPLQAAGSPGRPSYTGRTGPNPKVRVRRWKKNPDRCAESADLFTNPRNDLSGTARKGPFCPTKTAEIARKRPKPAGNRSFFVPFRGAPGRLDPERPWRDQRGDLGVAELLQEAEDVAIDRLSPDVVAVIEVAADARRRE